MKFATVSTVSLATLALLPTGAFGAGHHDAPQAGVHRRSNVERTFPGYGGGAYGGGGGAYGGGGGWQGQGQQGGSYGGGSYNGRPRHHGQGQQGGGMADSSTTESAGGAAATDLVVNVASDASSAAATESAAVAVPTDSAASPSAILPAATDSAVLPTNSGSAAAPIETASAMMAMTDAGAPPTLDTALPVATDAGASSTLDTALPVATDAGVAPVPVDSSAPAPAPTDAMAPMPDVSQPMPTGSSGGSYGQQGSQYGSTSSSTDSSSSNSANSSKGSYNSNSNTQTQQYGSGSGGNGNGDFNSCVQTCEATFGQTITSSSSSSSSGSQSSSSSSSSSSNSSSSASSSGSTSISTSTDAAGDLIAGTGEVIVAPKKGDLRMVPFAITVPAGQTLTWIWGAGPHTVTQSSALAICNKTKEAGGFASGQQNKTFQFPVVIAQDTKPTWYFCGVKTHCEMGMFGLVNPAVTTVAASSFGAWMDNHAMGDSNFAQMKNETDTMCNGSPAMTWGSMFDLSELEPWALPYAAESVMATRQYYFNNPQVLIATRLASVNSTAADATTTEASVVPAASMTGSTTGAYGAKSTGAGMAMSAASPLAQASLSLAVVLGMGALLLV